MDDYRSDLIAILNDLEEAIRDLYEVNGNEFGDVSELIDGPHDGAEVI